MTSQVDPPDRDEAVTEATFIVCFECGHVWTRDALEEANYQGQVDSIPAGAPMGPERHRAEDIWFCPECIHDF